jgi:hypothetical protein
MTITLEDIYDQFAEDATIVATGITSDNKLFVVVQIERRDGELAAALRRNVLEELAQLPFLSVRDTLAVFFGKPEQVAHPEADADSTGANSEAAQGSAADLAEVEEESAAGFVVLVRDGDDELTIRHAFLCVEGLAASDGAPASTDEDDEYIILGATKRTNDGALPAALNAALAWSGGIYVAALHFVATESNEHEVAALSYTCRVVERFTFDEQPFVIFSLFN